MALQDQTPEQWRDRLNAELDARWVELGVYDAYYNGDQELAFITKKYRDAYGSFFKGLTDNWMPLVVDSSAERLRVQGFRFDNEDADQDAWKIWQANGMDAQASMVHTEAIKLSIAYWMVEPDGKDPRITAEHPMQVITCPDPADRRDRLAGFKKWADSEFVYANVYLPDRVVKYRTTASRYRSTSKEKRWETIGAASNPLKEVPIVPVPNNPTMLQEGRSDLAGGPIQIQNGINLLISTQLIGAEYIAYPLRILLGVDTPRDAQGRPLQDAELKASQTRLMMFPGDAREMDVKELSAADLNNIRDAIDGLVRDLTAQTRTPPHYVAGQIVNASGDALKAAETGLVSKVRSKMDPMGEAHEETMRLAFRSINPDDPRADSTTCETIWVDPETRSDAERVDAATKKATIGVPNEILWEDVGYSPQQIDRMRSMQEAEALLAATLAPPAPPPTNGQVPPENVPQQQPAPTQQAPPNARQ